MVQPARSARAFFTKFLYFSAPGALILGIRLANAIRKLSKLPRLVTGNRRSQAWTSYRYPVSLHASPKTNVSSSPSVAGLDDVDRLNSVNDEPETSFLGWSLGLYPNIKYLRLPLATPYAPTSETAMGDARLNAAAITISEITLGILLV